MSSLPQDLDVLTALARGDIFIITRDPDGTPVDERAGIEDVFAFMPNLTTVKFKSEVDLVAFLQVLANDDSVVLNVDTVNERFGMGGLPETNMHLSQPGFMLVRFQSSDNNVIQIQLKSDSTARRIVALDGSGNVESQIELRDAGEIHFHGPTADSRIVFFDSGDVGIGTTTKPSAGGGKVLTFGDNAGAPTMPANTGGVFADDVAGTVETFASDEDSNATQLTPHAKDAHDEMHLDTDLQLPRIRRTVFPLLERIVFYRDDTRTEISETYADYNARRSLVVGDNDFLKGKTHEEVEDEREAAYEVERAAAIAAGDPDPGPYVREVEDPAYATYRDRAEGLGTVKRVDSIVVSMGS